MATKDILRKLMGKDMSEGALSRATGVPQTTIHRILTGQITESKPSTLRPIAKYFKVTIAQLQGDEPLSVSKSKSTLNETKNEIEIHTFYMENGTVQAVSVAPDPLKWVVLFKKKPGGCPTPSREELKFALDRLLEECYKDYQGE